MISMTALTYERTARRKLESMGAKPIELSYGNDQLLELARQYAPRRIDQAMPHLLREWGVWAAIPQQALLDNVYGIDAVYNLRGYYLAVDFSLNWRESDRKIDKQIQLRHLYQSAGLDCALVWLECANPSRKELIAKANSPHPWGLVLE